MKLSSKLPKRNGLDESRLPFDLNADPQRTRLLIVEVQASKIEVLFDEFGDSYRIPTAEVVTAEYITDPDAQHAARQIARAAFDRRRGLDPLPGLDTTTGELLNQEA